MASDLKPCPFCGGEARFETYGGTACAVVCQTCGCGTPTMRLDDGMIAADLWNRRAERTCEFFYDEKMAEYACSACGELVSGSNPDYEYQVSHLAVLESFEYCPNCGARVIEEES